MYPLPSPNRAFVRVKYFVNQVIVNHVIINRVIVGLLIFMTVYRSISNKG
jgi:hypothetical protein